MVTDGLFASMSILARRAARRASSRVRAIDGEQRLAVEHHVPVREQRLVGEHRRDVVLAGNIGRRQNGDDARRRARRLEVQALQSATGLVGHADRDMQRARRLADIVDIVRRALNVQTRGIVRQRLMDDRGRESEDRRHHSAAWSIPIRVGAPAPEISMSAFSRRLAATVMR